MSLLRYILVYSSWLIFLTIAYFLVDLYIFVDLFLYDYSSPIYLLLNLVIGFKKSLPSIAILLAGLYVSFWINSFFGKWCPFNLLADGRVSIKHFAWQTLPLGLFLLAIGISVTNSQTFQEDIFIFLCGLVCIFMSLMFFIKYPNIFIKSEFNPDSRRLKYFALTFKGVIRRDSDFSNIIDVIEETFEQQKFIIHSVGIILKQSEEKNTEDKAEKLFLVRGRYLDALKTKNLLLNLLQNSFLKSLDN